MCTQGSTNQDSSWLYEDQERGLDQKDYRGVIEMSKEEMDFINIVSMVAAVYDCTIEDIDFDTRTVSLSCAGGKAQEVECAIAIGDIVNGAQKEVCFV